MGIRNNGVLIGVKDCIVIGRICGPRDDKATVRQTDYRIITCPRHSKLMANRLAIFVKNLALNVFTAAIVIIQTLQLHQVICSPGNQITTSRERCNVDIVLITFGKGIDQLR